MKMSFESVFLEGHFRTVAEYSACQNRIAASSNEYACTALFALQTCFYAYNKIAFLHTREAVLHHNAQTEMHPERHSSIFRSLPRRNSVDAGETVQHTSEFCTKQTTEANGEREREILHRNFFTNILV